MKLSHPRQLKELHAELLSSLEEHGDFIQQQLQDMQQMITTVSIQHRILRHLLPDERYSRQEQIIEADPDTCRWILEPGPPCSVTSEDYRQETSESFISWLRAGKDIFHICGKPGAGKSTLMKFIGGHLRTLKELKIWAGRRQLIFGQFYCWAPGTEAQRTLHGMLRSLLFQVLSQFPGLIEDLFPRQLVYMKTSAESDPSVERFQHFGNKQIHEAFDLLLNKTVNSDHRIFLLIDGLDELEGGDLVHEGMAARLKSWTTGRDIKVLVSSRPWPPFVWMFESYPRLLLNNLNRLDIRTYAISQLYQDRKICQLGVDRMKTTIEGIVEELVSQAQGTFLWAHLVLDNVRQGIRRHYSVNLLKAKIREYPSDLDDLYNALREPIEKSPIDKILSNRMLLLAAAAPKDFPLYTLAFSWLPEDDESGLLDPSFPPSTKCQPYSEQEVEERLQRVSERIYGLTRGLLEPVMVKSSIHGSARQEVRFCHQTARDYLITNMKRWSVLEESWPGFRQSDPYGRIYLADLIYSRVPESWEYLKKPFCRDFNPDTILKFEKPMQPFIFSLYTNGIFYCYNSDPDTDKFRFLKYTAYCRLDSFVLYEVASHSGAYPHPPEMSILLASMYSASMETDGDYQLTLGLLRSCLNRNNIVEVDVQLAQFSGDKVTTLPTWMIALILGLRKILRYCSLILSGSKETQCFNHPLLEVCCLLNELAVKFGQGLSVTVEVEVCYSKEDGVKTSVVDDIKRTFSVARLLEWAEGLDPGVVNLPANEVTEEQRTKGWILDTVPIMLEKNFPGAISQDYRIASWNLVSPTGSMAGELMRFIFKVF